MRRGDIHWVNLGPAVSSALAKRRPVLVVQENSFNDSRLATVIVGVITSHTQTAEHPGNVFLPAAASGLTKDSVVNVSQLLTINKRDLPEQASALPRYLLSEVDAGLRLVLGL